MIQLALWGGAAMAAIKRCPRCGKRSNGLCSRCVLKRPRREFPKTARCRGDCTPCPACQQERDTGVKVLGHEHKGTEVIRHSRPCMEHHCRYALKQRPNLHVGQHASEVFEIPQSCALDVADRKKPLGVQAVADLLGITKARARQIEARALAKLAERFGSRTPFRSADDVGDDEATSPSDPDTITVNELDEVSPFGDDLDAIPRAPSMARHVVRRDD